MSVAIVDYPLSTFRSKNVQVYENKIQLNLDGINSNENAGLYVGANADNNDAYIRLNNVNIWTLKSNGHALCSLPNNGAAEPCTLLSDVNLNIIPTGGIARNKIAASANANTLVINDALGELSHLQYVNDDFLQNNTISTSKLNLSALTQDKFMKIDNNGAIVTADLPAAQDVGFISNSLTTSNATPSIIYENSAFPDNSVSWVKCVLVCINPSTQDSSFRELVFKVKKGAALSTPTYVLHKNDFFNDENFNVSYDVQTAADTFNIRVVGIAAQNLKWKSKTQNENVA